MTNTGLMVRSESRAEDRLLRARTRIRVVDGMIAVMAFLDVILGLVFLLSK